MCRYSSKSIVIAVLLVASGLSICYTGMPAIANTPNQYGAVDIFTNKGGQGPNEYGGSYVVGETVEIYVYSSFDGIAYITAYEPDGSVVSVEPFHINAGQVEGFSTTASNPPGTSQLVLEVCPTTGGPPTPTPTLLLAPPSPDFTPSPGPAARNPPSGCASDTTWVEVIGGPADLAVSHCRVVPSQPRQEDSVTFYASVANIGGKDAYNFRVETYLDGGLYDSGSLSLRAGESSQVSSNRLWSAEDGSHNVRWVVNPDRSVEESNYGNNEISCSFFVSPHTITTTVTTTGSSTRTQTYRTTTTITVTTRTTKVYTTDTTVLTTVTTNPVKVTQTLTGLTTSTIYSPTVTVTVTSAQMVSNPLLWLALSTFAMVGGILRLPDKNRIRRLRLMLGASPAILGALRWLARHDVRKVLFGISLISLVILSVSTQGQLAYGSTVTITSTRTSTEWTTVTQSLTSTRYITSTATDTSTLTRTYTRTTTVRPTVTITLDRRSTTTTFEPTTTTKTILQPSVVVTIEPEEPTFLKESHLVRVSVRNIGNAPISGDLLVLEQYDGEPQRSVGPPELGWELNAQVDPSTPVLTKISLSPGASSSPTVAYFTANWNWIPPADNVEDWASILMTLISEVFSVLPAKEIVRIVTNAADTAGWVDALEGTSSAYVIDKYKQPNAAFLITAEMKSENGVVGSAKTRVNVNVPEIKRSAWAAAYDVALLSLLFEVIGVILSLVITGGSIALYLPYILGAIDGALLGSSLGTYRAAADPYTPFRTIHSARPNIPPTIANLPEGPSKTLAVSAITAGSYLDACSTAIDMFYTSTASNDRTHMLESLNMASKYLYNASLQVSSMKEAYGAVSQLIQPPEPALVEKAKKTVESTGLPRQFTQILGEMGLSSYEPTLKEILKATPLQIGIITVNNALSSLSGSIRREGAAINDTRKLLESLALGSGIPFVYIVASATVAIMAICVVRWRRQRERKDILLRRGRGEIAKDPSGDILLDGRRAL